MTVVWLLLAVAALFALVGLGGAVMLLTAEVAKLVAATKESVAISQQNAETSKRMADAIDRPRPAQTVFIETGTVMSDGARH